MSDPAGGIEHAAALPGIVALMVAQSRGLARDITTPRTGPRQVKPGRAMIIVVQVHAPGGIKWCACIFGLVLCLGRRRGSRHVPGSLV